MTNFRVLSKSSLTFTWWNMHFPIKSCTKWLLRWSHAFVPHNILITNSSIVNIYIFWKEIWWGIWKCNSFLCERKDKNVLVKKYNKLGLGKPILEHPTLTTDQKSKIFFFPVCCKYTLLTFQLEVFNIKFQITSK